MKYRVLNRHKIDWWIDYETLMAQYTQSAFLDWTVEAEISVVEKRFREYFVNIMNELHQCGNDNSSLYFTRFTPENDECLRGKFSTKWEPRFSVTVNTWKYDKDKTYIFRAGWTEEGAQEQIPYKVVYPPQSAELNDEVIQIPNNPSSLLKIRYGDDWKREQLIAPMFYRPDLVWGSQEMRKIYNK